MMRERSESNQVSESKGMTEFFVYILRCWDGSYYVGSTQDVDQRVKVHNDGNAAVYTRLRRPVNWLTLNFAKARRSRFVESGRSNDGPEQRKRL